MVIIEQIYINKFLDTKVTLFVCKNILKDENNYFCRDKNIDVLNNIYILVQKHIEYLNQYIIIFIFVHSILHIHILTFIFNVRTQTVPNFMNQ